MDHSHRPWPRTKATDDDCAPNHGHVPELLTTPTDHGNGPKPPAPIISDDLNVTQADPVGRYAVRIHFSDGHSSGLYTWAYLRELGKAETNA